MKPSFTYKGINSRNLGISILKIPPRVKPELRGEIITIPGRNGFLFESDNAYNSKTLEVECTFLPPPNKTKDEINKMIMDIICWLDGTGELILSDYPDYYYDATIINSISFERLLKRYRKFLVTFEVQPFSKTVESKSIEIFSQGEQTFEVSSYYDTPPIIYLAATGDVDITINDTTMHLQDLETDVIINCELMNVTDENGVNMNNKMSGDFPTLMQGDNTINIICTSPSVFTSLKLEYKGLWL